MDAAGMSLAYTTMSVAAGVVGGVDGGADGVVTATLSNVDVLSVFTSWLVTASPMFADTGMVVVVLPTVVQVLPFADTEAVTVLPVRVSLSQAGVGCVP